MQDPVTENWKGFCMVEKKLKAREKEYALKIRIIDAKERSLKQRRPTKSGTALDKRELDEMDADATTDSKPLSCLDGACSCGT